ncbi:MAG TPA: CoA pyrophosphatase [Rectinemataceae bacterium]|nr:CoA pyrophosphatase [Rectinemataceae bacterium]
MSAEGALARDDVGTVLARLKAALLGSLPGMRAHELMMPSIRRLESLDRPAWRKAAVLILLYPIDGRLFFPLTLRRDDLLHHAGQISLPGGSLEEGESPEEAALRESSEEIGVDPSNVEMLGRLSPLKIPPSGFEIDPFVGSVPFRPHFVPEEREVACIIEAPLSMLTSDEAYAVEEWELKGGRSTVPFYTIGGHKVWGATAMVLAELAEIARG